VLKNLARDWSAEGAAERAQSYGRICAELDRLFADRWGALGAEPVSGRVGSPVRAALHSCLKEGRFSFKKPPPPPPKPP